MKSCVRRKCVKNVGDAHRAVIFLVGFAFAVILEMSSGKGLVWGQSSNMDPSVTIPLIVVFCDTQRLPPAVFLPTIIWLGAI